MHGETVKLRSCVSPCADGFT